MPLPQGGRPLRGANAGWWSLHFAFHHTARSVTATTSRRVFTTASQRCVSGQRPVHADAATFPHCFIRHTPSALYRRMAAAITATIITMAPTINQFLPILRVLAPPIVLLLPIVCGSLCCPPSFFFLLGFLRFSHGLPLCHQGGCRLWSLAV